MAHNFNEYFKYYIELVNSTDIISAMEKNQKEVLAIYQKLDEDKGDFRYAEGKWTLKELLLHIMDCERIFCYRALRFSRNDKTDLKGFDHDTFVEYTDAENRTVKNLVEEFVALRESTRLLFKNFNAEMLLQKGTANQLEIDVRSLGYMVSGHCTHHLRVIEEKYL